MSVKTNIRDGAARLMLLAGATMPGRRSRGRLSIVTFHRVLPENERRSYPFPGLAVTPEELDALLTYFTRHFDCDTLASQHERYLNGESSSRPLLAVTFDDGQYDNYRYARPVLARHGIKASFFIPVEAVERQELLWPDRLGFALIALLQADGGRARLEQFLNDAGLSTLGPSNLVGNVVAASKGLSLQARLSLVEKLDAAAGSPDAPEFSRLMNYGEIAELAAGGHEIGSHSMTHCLMPECDDRQLAWELAESRSRLQARLGLPIDTFCYPNGNSDSRTARAVADAGYRRAVTTTWGGNGPEADRFQLRRYDMDIRHMRDAAGKLVPDVLALRMSGFYPGL